MVVLFDQIEIIPLWRKQKKEDPFHLITLLIGIAGLVHVSFSTTVWIISDYTYNLLILINVEIPEIFNLFRNYLYMQFVTIFIDFLLIFILLTQSDRYNMSDITSDWNELKLNLSDAKELEDITRSESYMLAQYVAFSLFFGLLAGLWYFVLFILPIFALFMFIFLILMNILNLTSAYILSIFMAWFIVISFFLKRKLKEEEISQQLNYSQEYQFTDRTYQILASGAEPIICPGCRSYIASTSRTCQVCGEEISNES
ncbi:MAG: hypothetical protein INQ03_02105 [Candidatus Heimdallarchaeota archaeon]|nr:hypothetical protein [Candidatus Heimdallarchaeota archaeon]